MVAIQRSKKILELLHERKSIYVRDLTKLFGVSEVTIRKDLKKLEAEGFVTKIHGGALLNDKTIIPNHNFAIDDSLKIKKDRLAAYTLKHIKKGDAIFLGSGYACVSFARQLSKESDLSIITNNIEAIPYLIDKCKTLILLGGEVITHKGNFFTSSSDINEQLKEYNISKAITSCSGVDLDLGISFSTEISKRVISAVLNNSQSWYLMADSSKFDNVFPYKISNINVPEIIITDNINKKYQHITSIIKD